jgi:hypothetical protein
MNSVHDVLRHLRTSGAPASMVIMGIFVEAAGDQRGVAAIHASTVPQQHIMDLALI